MSFQTIKQKPMSKITKIILIIAVLSIAITALTIFYKGEGIFLGRIPDDTVFRGFPGHFYESSSEGKKFLFPQFF